MTLLDDHGTTLNELKPASIVQAAEADLRRREENRATQYRKPGREHYAFHRLHVRKSTCALDLLSISLRDLQRGPGSGKRWTRLIYGDAGIIERALELARSVPSETEAAA